MSKKNFAHCTGAVALALAFPLMTFAADAPEGQLLFVNGPVKIVDTAGAERVARKGDLIAPGERLVTGIGGMGQLKMSDGGFIGVRQDSDLKIEKTPPAGAAGDRQLHLAKGAVRTINIDAAGMPKPLPIVLGTPTANIALRNADHESVVVPQRPGTTDSGTYSRMAVGDGEVKTLRGDTKLALNSVLFAPVGSAVPPANVGTLPESGARIAALPVAAGATPLQPPSFPPVLASKSPDTIRPPLPSIPPPPPKLPPPKLQDGSIDLNTVSVAKLQTLPPATLATLPSDILAKLPATTIATLPTATQATVAAATTAPTTTLVKFTAPLQTVLKFK